MGTLQGGQNMESTQSYGAATATPAAAGGNILQSTVGVSISHLPVRHLMKSSCAALLRLFRYQYVALTFTEQIALNNRPKDSTTHHSTVSAEVFAVPYNQL